MKGIRVLLLGLAFGSLCLAAAPPTDPWFIDDEQFIKDFSDRLTDLVKKKECLRPSELKEKLQQKSCKLDLHEAPTQALAPDEIYRRAMPSVFVLGSVVRSDKELKKWDDGRQATAWVLTADGVMVTNWHVFEKAGKERFGVANAKGEVFPVIDILAGDADADVAVIRVKGKDFQPLALGGDEPVASWVGVLSHPGGQLFMFTQGFVTRYNKDAPEDKKPTHWLSISADYAQGSSGAPVLNKCGAVIGMAAMTQTIESDEDEDPASPPKTRRRRQEPAPMPKPAPKDEKQPDAPKATPQVQMVTKLAVPARVIRKLVQEE
jgi:S1-C subfamily serine protease